MIFNMITLSSVLLVSACISKPSKTVYIPTYLDIPEELMFDCSSPNIIEKGDGNTLAPWILDTLSKNKECSDSKKAIVEIIKKQKENKQ